MRLLILGGTIFLGRALTDTALLDAWDASASVRVAGAVRA